MKIIAKIADLPHWHGFMLYDENGNALPGITDIKLHQTAERASLVVTLVVDGDDVCLGDPEPAEPVEAMRARVDQQARDLIGQPTRAHPRLADRSYSDAEG